MRIYCNSSICQWHCAETSSTQAAGTDSEETRPTTALKTLWLIWHEAWWKATLKDIADYQQWPKSLLFQPFILIVSQVFNNRKCLRTKTKTDCCEKLKSRDINRFAPFSYKKSCIASVAEEEMVNVGVCFFFYEKQDNQGGGTYLFTRSNCIHITVRVYPLNPILSAAI